MVAGMMTTVSAVLAGIGTWPWSMISAFLGAGSVSVIVYTQLLRPWNRRRRLKKPFDAYFLITSLSRFNLDYVLQDDDEHFVKELVLPANSEVPIQIILEPRISFTQHELYFGCSENVVNREKPHATEYFVPFVKEGMRRSGKPDEHHPGHYTDYNGFYHVRENLLYTRDTRVIGFKLKTGAVGVYAAQVFVVTDDVRGKADLKIRVEDPVRTKMRCVYKPHRTRGCFVSPVVRLQ
jgi:hypothetical protein